ncbi:hypothetical protein MKI84_08400 [Ancylobacter sp. A5.8]|uniref:hypothetical protein n=1 Tax=Ancylobacter gelatini TaxID=2919920 RepID=UPI001F4D4DE6|nr:hypothetical protein [Ancylobacter gelatini]MCJ8142935.1 hypothetical protein [Ancylobacter gelatini]
MSDERAAVDTAAVTRAVRTARLLCSSRRMQTGLSVEEAQNLGRVLLAMNLAANSAADLLLAFDQTYDPANDEQTAAYDVRVAETQQNLAGVLLTLGFIQFPKEEATDGQEG